MKILLEVNNNKASEMLTLLKSIDFIKSVKQVSDNEITNSAILKSIEDYEINKVQPSLCNMEDLKALIHA